MSAWAFPFFLLFLISCLGSKVAFHCTLFMYMCNYNLNLCYLCARWEEL
ncbi:MAG: hypothetical protein PARBA_01016 [Parabacteroides sp.]